MVSITAKGHKMTISKQTERVSARVPAQVYQTLTQAAEISGATLNQFLVQSALEKNCPATSQQWMQKTKNPKAIMNDLDSSLFRRTH
jgi:uncharacterized protein (DUF1778 family)